MMVEVPTFIENWDQATLKALSSSPRQNILEFDQSLWTFVHVLCANANPAAQANFNLSDETVEFLANQESTKIIQLASGTLLSFSLAVPESEIFNELAKPYSVETFVHRTEHHEFDAAYWLLMNRVAGEELYAATQVFGISLQMARSIAQATDLQVRHLATTVQTCFSLRFNQDLIPHMLDNTILSNCHLKRVIQSLDSWRGEK